MPMTNAQSSAQSRRATLDMVRVRLSHIAEQPNHDPQHLLAMLSSMKSVLMVIESQAPGEDVDLANTMGIVEFALSEASRNAHSVVYYARESLVH